MKLSLLTIIGLLPLAIGLSFAYADHAVPFDSWIDHSCNQLDNGTFLCQWIPSDNATFTSPTLVEEDEEVVDDTEGQALEVELEEELNLTREQRDIKRTIEKLEQDLIEDPEMPNSDKQLLILLKRAQTECYFGVNEGQPIQAYALFGIPDGFLYIDDTDFSRHTQLGKIAQLIQACIHWDDYRVSHLGQQYADIAQAFEDQVIWSPNATLSSNVTNTDEFMNRQISEHDILEDAEDAAIFMCNEQGKQRGLCPKAIGEDVYQHDTTDNPVLSKYLQYRDAPENAVGEPRYNVSTNAKCYTLESFSQQYELDEESRRSLLEAAGCRI